MVAPTTVHRIIMLDSMPLQNNNLIWTSEPQWHIIKMYASAVFKTFPSMPAHMMNTCAKFHWNASTKYRDVEAWAIGVNRQTTDAWHTQTHIASFSVDSSESSGKIIVNA